MKKFIRDYRATLEEKATKKEDKMDPVDKKQAKGDFNDRNDKDINNDGKVDGTDKYLHKRRKAISTSSKEDEPKKNGGEETAVMNPKKKDDTTKESTKESTFRDKLMSIWEAAAKQPNQSGAAADKGADAENGSAKKMKDGHKQVEVRNDDEKGHDDASKAGRTGPTSKPRNSGDQTRSGDQSVINKIAAAYKGMKNGN